MNRVPLYFDIETSDPDDVVAVCILATHPRVDLLGVSVIPGSREQVGLLRHVLSVLGREDVRVAADTRKAKPEKSYVSGFHRKWLGDWKDADPDETPTEAFARLSRERPPFVLLTGARLTNPHEALIALPDVTLSAWIGQGGFAGDSVVPPEHRLVKFVGRETCPTFNFGGDVSAAKFMLESKQVGFRYLVSKNVCHGVLYDDVFAARVAALPQRTAGLELVHKGMSRYLREKGHGKALHDVLAAAVAISVSVCGFREVEVYRERGEWGSRLSPGNTCISVSVDSQRFFDVVTEVS